MSRGISINWSYDLTEKHADLLPHAFTGSTDSVSSMAYALWIDEILKRANPDELTQTVAIGNKPVRTFCLFSGGHDSSVLAHRMRDSYDELAFVDTGTAVPGVRDFVEQFALWIDKPLRVFEADDAYRRMVIGDSVWWERFFAELKANPDLTIQEMEKLNKKRYGYGSGVVRGGEYKGFDLGSFPHGFPGPGGHSRAYSRLKERQLERLLAIAKKEFGSSRSRVLFLSGVRRDESKRRQTREPITRRYSAVFCNPLINWTNKEMHAYRSEHGIPESDVAALLHRSGECNCGAYAKPGERQDLISLYGTWYAATLGALETEAQRLQRYGLKHCVWGDGSLEEAIGESGPMCTDCDARFLVAQEVAAVPV